MLFLYFYTNAVTENNVCDTCQNKFCLLPCIYHCTVFSGYNFGSNSLTSDGSIVKEITNKSCIVCTVCNGIDIKECKFVVLNL